MQIIKRILNFLKLPVDIIILILIIPSAIIMLFFRKFGSHKLTLSKSILKKIGIFPLTSNYYEPLFNFDNLKNKLSEKRNLPGIKFDTDNQIKNLRKFNYQKELDKLSFNINNNFFEAGDAEIYYQMIRHFKPNKIIEIGSGHSSLIAKEAIRNNKEIDNFKSELICIEPYENKWLEEKDIKVIRQKVEEVDVGFFTELNNLSFNIKNNFFEGGDAEIYYQMTRYFKPKKIIEIGSGHSSLIAKEAIKNNKEIDNFTSKLICIEPYENAWLEKNYHVYEQLHQFLI